MDRNQHKLIDHQNLKMADSSALHNPTFSSILYPFEQFEVFKLTKVMFMHMNFPENF